MAKSRGVVKRGPWLERHRKSWAESLDTEFKYWFCASGVDLHCDLKGASHIQICGSINPMPESEPERPQCNDWKFRDAERLEHRHDAYAYWLESFNAPVVYVWVEGWWPV